MDQVYKVTMSSQTIIADSEMITIRSATAYASRASKLAILRMSCGQTSTTTSAVSFVKRASASSASASTAKK